MLQDVSPADHKATIHHLSMAAHYYYSENRCYRCWSEYIFTHFLNLLVSFFFSMCSLFLLHRTAARSKCRLEMARLHGLLSNIDLRDAPRGPPPNRKKMENVYFWLNRGRGVHDTLHWEHCKYNMLGNSPLFSYSECIGLSNRSQTSKSYFQPSSMLRLEFMRILDMQLSTAGATLTSATHIVRFFRYIWDANHFWDNHEMFRSTHKIYFHKNEEEKKSPNMKLTKPNLSRMLKYSADEYFFRAALCHLAIDRWAFYKKLAIDRWFFLQKELATYWQVSLYKKLALGRWAFYNCTSCDWNVMEQLTKQLVSPLMELKGGQGRNILNTICLKFIPRRINFKALLNLMFAKIYRGGQYIPW